jgi:hypothetical protein
VWRVRPDFVIERPVEERKWPVRLFFELLNVSFNWIIMYVIFYVKN